MDRPARPLPGARAAVGGFLVATAVVGLLAVESTAGRSRSGQLDVASGVASAELQVSLAVDPSRALGSRLGPGDIVDVFVTTGQGPQSTTSVVVRRAVVVNSEGGSTAARIVTLGLPTDAAVQGVLTASAVGVLSLVRPPATARAAPTVVGP